jgi:ABC-type transporter Mla subunit MlaD
VTLKASITNVETQVHLLLDDLAAADEKYARLFDDYVKLVAEHTELRRQLRDLSERSGLFAPGAADR